MILLEIRNAQEAINKALRLILARVEQGRKNLIEVYKASKIIMKNNDIDVQDKLEEKVASRLKAYDSVIKSNNKSKVNINKN